MFLIELAPIWDNLDTFPAPELKKEFAGRVSEQVLAVAATHKIDFCVCMWGNGPATLADDGTQNFFDVNKLPILMHWLDAPQWAHQSQVLGVPRWAFNGPYNYHYINNSTTAQEMAGVLGFSNIITLSNAASPTTFSPQPAGEKDFDIIFGVAQDTVKPTPLMLKELEKDEPNVQAIRADMAASLRDQLIDVVRPAIKRPTPAERLVDQVLNGRLVHRHAAILEQVGRIAHVQPALAESVLALLQDPKRYVQFSSVLRQIES